MTDHFLQPGEIYFSKKSCVISTILGSCIAVCIHDKKNKYGGMCHYYLPNLPEGGSSRPNKYGDHAIRALLKEFKKAGSVPQDLVAKVVGGGHVLDSVDPKSAPVGRENIKIAIETLAKFSIPIEKKAVGGFTGRKIRQHTETNLVQMKNTKEVSPAEIKKTLSQKTRVLIVDDSQTIQNLLKQLIEADQSFEVVGVAKDAFEAERFLKSNPVDLITLDMQMPGLSGDALMERTIGPMKIPTLIVSGVNPNESKGVIRALKHGAFDFYGKPSAKNLDNYMHGLHERLHAAYGSRERKRSRRASSNQEKVSIIRPAVLMKSSLIVIGSSTGGTEALKEILYRLPENIPPIAIVQHIPPGFSRSYSEHLNEKCSFEVVEARHGEILKPGKVVIAPGDHQMKIVRKENGDMSCIVNQDAPVNSFRPSVDYLFKNLPIERFAQASMAIMLTGMGADGSQGMLELRKRGVHTVGQDEQTSVVYGMPKAAFDIGAVEKQLPIDKIAQAIADFCNKRMK